jgi:hypothetical protein
VSLAPEQLAELHDLLWALRAGTIVPEQLTHLERLVCEDPRVRTFYVRYMHLCADLYWNRARDEGRETEDFGSVELGFGIEASACGPTGSGAASAPHEAIVAGRSPLPNPQGPNPSISFPASLLSLGTPLGSFVFSYAAATVIVGIGILIAWMCHVSEPQSNRLNVAANRRLPTVRQPSAPQDRDREVVSVARVTDMVECTWTDAKQAPSIQRILLGDKFALASGLMEITYDTGAKVILQGPCSYTAESKTGGYLARGKLIARVEKKGRGREGETGRLADRGAAVNSTSQISHLRPPSDKSPPLPLSPSLPLFSIRTPNAVVNDLGTEFGVEVDENNGSGVYVFVGTVDLVPAGRSSGGVRIGAGEARRVSAGQGGTTEKIGFDRDGFAKPRAMLAGKYKQDETFFTDTFETFALGKRWRARGEGAPDEALMAVSDNGRPALWMKSKAAAKKQVAVSSIETVERFPLHDLASIQAEAVFRASEKSQPQFQVWLVGSAGRAVRICTLGGSPGGVGAGVLELGKLSHNWGGVATSPVGHDVYQNGERYRYRVILSVNRRDTRVLMQDDVNMAVVYEAKFNELTLAALGDNVRAVLRLVTYSKHASECWVYGVTVRGRPSAIQQTSPKKVPSHIPELSQSSRVKSVGSLHIEEKEAAR